MQNGGTNTAGLLTSVKLTKNAAERDVKQKKTVKTCQAKNINVMH